MGILSYLFSKRDEPKPPSAQSDFWYNPITSRIGGVVVSPETAMQNTVILACVRVIAETIASLPLHMYRRRPDGGKERETEQSLYKILHVRPNKWQTHFRFFEMLTGHALLRGNGYAQIQRNARGKVLSLVPLNPTRVEPKYINGEKIYFYTDNSSQRYEIPADEVLHIQGLSSDGLKGISVIEQARRAVALALAAEEHGTDFFQNDATPGGILTHPTVIGDEAQRRLKEQWMEGHGPGKRGGIAIFEEGMQWQTVGVTNKDAQFLELRRMQVEELARLFRVPLHMVGDLTRSTNNNIEHQSIEFVVHCLVPWLRRWEEELNQSLIPEAEWGTSFVEFSVDGLLRGDIKSRFEAYAVARNNGWMNVDEIRALENMNPLDNNEGKEFLRPLNMVPVGEPDPKKEPDPTSNSEPAQDAADQSRTDAALERTQYAFIRAAEEGIDRIIRREIAEIRDISKRSTKINQAKNPENLSKTVENYRKMVAEGLKSTTLAWIEAIVAAQGRSVRLAGKLQNTPEMAQELVQNWADAYANKSKNELGRALNGADAPAELELLATNYSRSRAKNEAELWIPAIRSAVETELAEADRPKIINNIKVDVAPQIILPEPALAAPTPKVRMKKVFTYKEDANGKPIGGESWEEPIRE